MKFIHVIRSDLVNEGHEAIINGADIRLVKPDRQDKGCSFIVFRDEDWSEWRVKTPFKCLMRDLEL